MNDIHTIHGRIKAVDGVLKGSVRVGKFSGEIYDGDYSVTPSNESQSLQTSLKTLTNDIYISPIPYSEEENSSGGITVKIG